MLLVRAAALGGGLVTGILFPPLRRGRGSIRSKGWAAHYAKRFLDLAGAGLGLVISLPLVLAAALAVRLEDGGPAFYIQVRAGQHGKPFRMLKLRTMVVGAEIQVEEVLGANPLSGPVFKLPNDPRVTRVGRFLRRWSLDELPQLWNVLKGEMSLVGPRPEELWVVAQYTDEQRKRLGVKPGMTGPMQVNGRGMLDMEARLALELEYIQNYSLLTDLRLLLRTAPAVLRGKGAF
jgi:lipopolysaccharide/colanic/teichoic acid biosynthesis glycosyltransferase